MARTRGRRRRIEQAGHPQATFSELRAELFREACELGVLCGADMALIVFDPAGNAFAFGSPDSADDVLRRHFPVPADNEQDVRPVLGELEEAKEEEDTRAPTVITKEQEETRAATMGKAEQARMDALLEKLQPAMEGKSFLWEADVDKIGKTELPEFVWALERFRDCAQSAIGISSLEK
ncbi:hypothetical protein ACQ4PT_056447 [Festuca glaucescens]